MRATIVLLLITVRATFADVRCPAPSPARSSLVLLDQASLSAVGHAARQANQHGSVKISPIWERARCFRNRLAGHTVRIALDRRDAGRHELVGIAGQGIIAESIMRDPEDAWVELKVIDPGAAARAIGAIWRGKGAPRVVATLLPPDPSRGRSDDSVQCVDDWGDLSQPIMANLIDAGPVRLAMRSEPGSTIIESWLDGSAPGSIDGPAELTVDGARLTPTSSSSWSSPRRASFVFDPRCPDGRLVSRTVTVRATWRTKYRFAASKQHKTYTAVAAVVVSTDGKLYRQ